MKLDRKVLERELGHDYTLKGADWEVWLWVQFLDKRIAHLNINDGTIDSWLLIKWREKPDGWKPYEEELGGEELLDAELRPHWEAAGWRVDREGISSCWYPAEKPMKACPAVEVPMGSRAKGLQDAVAAIQLLASAQREVSR